MSAPADVGRDGVLFGALDFAFPATLSLSEAPRPEISCPARRSGSAPLTISS